jgi:ERCC4-related helicase
MNSDDENCIFELADEIVSLTENLPDEDPKLEKLYEIIEQKQHEENNRVIIFSSFRHTLAYVRRHLQQKGIALLR